MCIMYVWSSFAMPLPMPTCMSCILCIHDMPYRTLYIIMRVLNASVRWLSFNVVYGLLTLPPSHICQVTQLLVNLDKICS